MKRLLTAASCAVCLLWAEAAVTDANATAVNVAQAEAKTRHTLRTVTLTRGNVKIIEATEQIRFLSQEMAKMYLFMFKAPRKDVVRTSLKKMLLRLNDNLQVIKTTTKDADTKDILEFLAYSKDQIAQIIAEDLSEENAALMLDYSETLLEGADSIAAAHAYAFTKEERMLIVNKKMEYLLERMMKYYFAIHLGFDNTTNREQLKAAVLKFDNDLNVLRAYEYPEEMRPVTKELERSWKNNRRFFETEDRFIPKLMLYSTAYAESLIGQVTLYHNKNL